MGSWGAGNVGGAWWCGVVLKFSAMRTEGVRITASKRVRTYTVHILYTVGWGFGVRDAWEQLYVQQLVYLALVRDYVRT